jgi:uncharacterized protein YneF (UPF0154 family)
MSDKNKFLEMVEYLIPNLDLMEPVADLVGDATRAVAVMGKLFPPVALVLEGFVSLVEFSKDLGSKHMSRLDKGAQMLVVASCFVAGSMGIAAFFVAALSPLMPVAAVIATSLIALGSFHKMYLKNKDPEFIQLKQQRDQLKRELAKGLEGSSEQAVKKILDNPHLTFLEKRQMIFSVVPEESQEKIRDVMHHIAAFEKKTEDYKEKVKEMRHLGVKGVVHGLILAVAILGMLAAMANPFVLPAIVAGLTIGYVLYKTSILGNLGRFISGLTGHHFKLNDTQKEERDRLMNELGLDKSQAAHVALMQEAEKDIYHRHEGTHEEKLKVVSAFQQLNKEQQQIYHQLQDSHEAPASFSEGRANCDEKYPSHSVHLGKKSKAEPKKLETIKEEDESDGGEKPLHPH